MDDGENLGPIGNMQIRSVPEAVRKYWNNLAHAQDQTLGEFFTAFTIAHMRGEDMLTAVRTTVNASSSGIGVDDLCRVIETAERYAVARKRDLTPSTKEGRAATLAFNLLHARIRAELKLTMVRTTVNQARISTEPQAADPP